MKTRLLTILFPLFLSCNSFEAKKEPLLVNRDSLLQSRNEKASFDKPKSEDDSVCVCNAKSFFEVRLNIHKASKEAISSFLSCCSEEFFDDVEFSEFAHYFVFLLLEHKPDLTLHILHEHCRTLPIDNILSIIESPISDQINIDNVYKKVEGVNTDAPMKERVLNSLNLAIKKYQN